LQGDNTHWLTSNSGGGGGGEEEEEEEEKRKREEEGKNRYLYSFVMSRYKILKHKLYTLGSKHVGCGNSKWNM
jgi:hypothetical protein